MTKPWDEAQLNGSPPAPSVRAPKAFQAGGQSGFHTPRRGAAVAEKNQLRLPPSDSAALSALGIARLRQKSRGPCETGGDE